jgi:hypothetical protein
MTIVAKREKKREIWLSDLFDIYQHKTIILHFDSVKVPKINEEFENNVHRLIKPLIYSGSSMEFESAIPLVFPGNSKSD